MDWWTGPDNNFLISINMLNLLFCVSWRYNEIFLMVDTCQAYSMTQKLYSPNILAVGSSLVGEDSLSVSINTCNFRTLIHQPMLKTNWSPEYILSNSFVQTVWLLKYLCSTIWPTKQTTFVARHMCLNTQKFKYILTLIHTMQSTAQNGQIPNY